jgi:hypothetical protein
MSRQHLRRAIPCLAAIALAAVPAAARGDGLPVPVEDAGLSGVAVPGDPSRYVTLGAGRDTLVGRVEQTGGRVPDTKLLRGDFTIPAVALDASPSGLSHDGRTLVLVRPRQSFPRASTTFAILATKPRLRVRRVVTLRGDFSFDAISPSGKTVFLIQYTDRYDPTRYLVRTMDPATGRLQRGAVVDPDETGDDMRGFAHTRATSPDGRWEYTLYDGAGGGHPFVHALDTEQPAAKCIDLPATLAGVNMSSLRLRVAGDGARLTVERSRRPLALIDTRTFRVSAPPRTPAVREAGEDGTDWTQPAVLAGLVAVVATAFAVAARRRPRTAA